MSINFLHFLISQISPSQVKSSKSEGRYMVAKQKILPGDVLVVEPAFTTSLFRDFYSTNCLHCFQRLPEEPVCCPGCTTVSSYCSRCQRPASQWAVWRNLTTPFLEVVQNRTLIPKSSDAEAILWPSINYFAGTKLF